MVPNVSKVSHDNSCRRPTKKKRRVWEVLGYSDMKVIKYIKISKSDIADISDMKDISDIKDIRDIKRMGRPGPGGGGSGAGILGGGGFISGENQF